MEGNVEYNPETDGSLGTRDVRKDKDGEEIDLTDSERQRTTYLLISAYFDEVWG